jgi:hypothetical protein
VADDDLVAPLRAFGFTERQARFLGLVLEHSGVCLSRQYRAFAGIAHGRADDGFFDRSDFACKKLQAVPEQGSTNGFGGPRGGAADPGFPGSAGSCVHRALPTNQEIAGSSPAGTACRTQQAASCAQVRPAGALTLLSDAFCLTLRTPRGSASSY